MQVAIQDIIQRVEALATPLVEEEGIEEDERRPVKPRRRPREDDDDDDEEYERRPRRRSIRKDTGDEVVSTIIPYKNPKALAGYYCGIFSLFPILGKCF